MYTSTDIFKSRTEIVKLERITQSENNRILQNHLTREGENVDLPPWFLSFELFNKSLNKIFQIRKKQEVGYFMIINDAWKEIHNSFKKEHENTIYNYYILFLKYILVKTFYLKFFFKIDFNN